MIVVAHAWECKLSMRRSSTADSAPDAVQLLDRQLPSLDAGTAAAAFALENVLAEVEDLLSYCNDILCTGAGCGCLAQHSMHACMQGREMQCVFFVCPRQHSA